MYVVSENRIFICQKICKILILLDKNTTENYLYIKKFQDKFHHHADRFEKIIFNFDQQKDTKYIKTFRNIGESTNFKHLQILPFTKYYLHSCRSSLATFADDTALLSSDSDAKKAATSP